MQVTIHQPVHEPIYRAVTDALYGTGTAAFSPASLFTGGEQGAWYDFSDMSTLFQDSAGSTPVTADGQVIGKVLDKSGRGNHLIQATTSLKPIYKTSGGLHWAEFDGVDDGLATASTVDFTATDKMGVFKGISYLSDSAAIPLELSANYNANIGSFYVSTGLDNGTGMRSASRGNAAVVVGQATYANTYNAPQTRVLTFTHDIAGDLSRCRLNGVYATDGTADKGTGNFGNYTLYVCRRGGASLPLSGQINQLVVLGRTPTAGEITSTESFIATKTGVTL